MNGRKRQSSLRAAKEIRGNEEPGAPAYARKTFSWCKGAQGGRIPPPACAGKTEPLLYQIFAKFRIPRVCGENRKTQKKTLRKCGSPPRVQGKRGNLLNAWQ